MMSCIPLTGVRSVRKDRLDVDVVTIVVDSRRDPDEDSITSPTDSFRSTTKRPGEEHLKDPVRLSPEGAPLLSVEIRRSGLPWPPRKLLERKMRPALGYAADLLTWGWLMDEKEVGRP